MLNNFKVSIAKTTRSEYPKEAPFNPSENYPEYQFSDLSQNSNLAYKGIRDLLFSLNLDKENFGTKDWNPFKKIIKPQDVVVIKPALTTAENYAKNEDVFSIIPHPSIIRAIIDYVLKAQPKKIIICDGPIPNTKWEKLMEIVKFEEIINFLNSNQKIPVSLIDLRDEYSPKDKENKIKEIISLPGDPLGYSIIDLGKDSLLDEISDDWKMYRSVSSNKFERYAPPFFHNKIKNEYSIANTLLEADVIINVSKLKTHRKVGFSCASKNIVGITNKKFWLPHYREGIDDNPYNKMNIFLKNSIIFSQKLISLTKRKIQRGNKNIKFPINDGNWPGDDTCWRMVLDLSRIMTYCDKNGNLKNEPQRKHIAFIDGIKGGQGWGPLATKGKKSKILIASENTIAADAVAATILGYDFKKLKIFQIPNSIKYPISKISSLEEIETMGTDKIPNLSFDLPFGWKKLN